MVKFLVSLLFVLCYRPECTNGANILAVFPFPGYPKYLIVKPYLEALAKRGHNLTVISNYQQLLPVPNFHDITVRYAYYTSKIYNAEITPQGANLWEYVEYIRNITYNALADDKVQALLHSKQPQFKLVILDASLAESLYALGPHFGAHLIGVTTRGTDAYIDTLVGNLSPLSYIQQPRSELSVGSHTLWERTKNLYFFLGEYFYICFRHWSNQRIIYDKYFPHLPYRLGEIVNNFSLVLLNEHFSMSHPRSYVPNMIEVGGMCIDHKPQNLSHSLQKFMNDAEHGVIYYSTGQNIQNNTLDKKNVAILVKLFESLKQRVLWRHHDVKLQFKTNNVVVSPLFSHWDVLNHPNVKLYITHGDVVTITEAIYFAKPILILPIFFEQKQSLKQIKNLGIGHGHPYASISNVVLKRNIEKILSDSKFTENVQELSKRFHDQPQKPLDKAIFWTEYILRHGGAKHIRVPTNDYFFWELYSIDAVFYYLLVFNIVAFLLIKCTLKTIGRIQLVCRLIGALGHRD